jgi:hydroxymethylpyrimidine pyrophosphatase-like HAD family hydrolase
VSYFDSDLPIDSIRAELAGAFEVIHATVPMFAYGDGLNDLEMLRYVKLGVAMGNAHPTLLDVADLVTADADGDGILLGFQRLGLI